MATRLALLAAATFALLPPALPAALADDPPAAPAGAEPGTQAAPAAEEAPAPETETLAPGPFAVTVELTAAFEPAETEEVLWKPEVLGGEVEVLEAARAGMVEAGQVLVRLDAPRQREQVGLARMDVEIAAAHVAKLEEDDRRREQALALQRAALVRDAERAAEDLARFVEVERPLRLSEAEHHMKGAENGLQDAIEELAQLEKMYKADDLTEETEDIVLKRSQRELARSKERLAFQRQRHEWVGRYWLPRDQQNLEHQVKATRQELERFDATNALVARKQHLEIQKAVQEHALQKQNLARMESDLAALVLKAPRAGRIVPGTLAKGRWQGVEETARLLEPGEKVRAHQVLFTLFTCDGLRLRTQVPEAHAFHAQEGAKGTVAPTADDEAQLPVTLTWLSPVAVEGKYEALFSLDVADARLLPGLSGKLTLRTRERADALTVPEASVTKDGDKAVVHVWKDGAAAARPVKLGAASDGRVEVKEGLEAGAQVLVKAPAKP
jgi:HlyD family secretion protein